MILAATPSNSFNAPTPDEAAIQTTVESVANLADKGNFESLEKLYADEVQVDYTSAFGGEVEIIPTGRNYNQRYGGLFHVVDGKIELFREYYDPIVFKNLSV